jgi:hypothetical protein
MHPTASQPVNATPARPVTLAEFLAARDAEVLDDVGEVEVTPPAGLLFGPPDYISEATLAVDRRAAARMKCPRCRRRGLLFEAYTDAKHGTYAPLARCGDYRCGFEEIL